MTALTRWHRPSVDPFLGAKLTIGLTILSAIIIDRQAGPVLQLPATILFLIGCPGLVSVDWFRMDRAALGGIIVASSIAFNTMVITILLVVDLFTISGAVFTMALMSLATAGASILLARRQARNSRGSE